MVHVVWTQCHVLVARGLQDWLTITVEAIAWLILLGLGVAGWVDH